MNKIKVLSIIKNIVWGIVVIETILLIHTMSNKIIDNKNRITKLEKQVVELKRGN